MVSYPRITNRKMAENLIVGTQHPDGSWASKSDYSGRIELGRKFQMNSYSTPNYRDQIRRRSKGVIAHLDLPINDYSEQNYYFTVPQSCFKVEEWYGVVRHYGFCLPSLRNFGNVPGSVFADLTNQNINRLKSEIVGNQFSLPIFLHELKGTTDMFLRFTRSLIDRLGLRPGRRRRPGRPSKGINFFGDPANMWLEYRYGWRLVMKDLYDGCVAIYDALNSGLSLSASTHSTWKQDLNYVLDYHNAGTSFGSYGPTCDCKVTGQQKVVVRHKIWYKTQSTGWKAKGLTLAKQFGITNPLSFIWDAIPLSFVVDWGIGVGEFLGGLDAFLGLDFVKGFRSELYIEESDWLPILKPGAYAGKRVVGYPNQESHCAYREYRRYKLTSFPTPQLPSVDLHLNNQRALDAAALLRQMLKGRK